MRLNKLHRTTKEIMRQIDKDELTNPKEILKGFIVILDSMQNQIDQLRGWLDNLDESKEFYPPWTHDQKCPPC